MSKYGTFACPDCGTSVAKTSPNMKRCKPCALRAHGQTGAGFAERACVECGTTYKPTGSHQKACSVCRDAFKAKQNTERLRQLRLAEGATPIGTVLMCSDCGDDFEYKAGPQHRCPSCQQAKKLDGIHRWLALDAERKKQYTQTAKDNYLFSGNRKAALERDKHTCQHCGSVEDLHVHHIDGKGTTTTKEFRNNALENLMTLCRSCHTKEHHRLRHSSCAPQM